MVNKPLCIEIDDFIVVCIRVFVSSVPVKYRCLKILYFGEIKIDDPIRLEYHTEKITSNSSEVNR